MREMSPGALKRNGHGVLADEKGRQSDRFVAKRLLQPSVLDICGEEHRARDRPRETRRRKQRVTDCVWRHRPRSRRALQVAR